MQPRGMEIPPHAAVKEKIKIELVQLLHLAVKALCNKQHVSREATPLCDQYFPYRGRKVANGVAQESLNPQFNIAFQISFPP